jgi:hypothetical protein
LKLKFDIFGGVSSDQARFHSQVDVLHSELPIAPFPKNQSYKTNKVGMGGAGNAEILKAQLIGNSRKGRTGLAPRVYPSGAAYTNVPKTPK